MKELSYNIKLASILLITDVFLGGCSTNTAQFYTWKNHEQLYQVGQKLKVGDIIITSKDWTRPISWLGHSAVMISPTKVGEYPHLCSGYYETNAVFWLSQKTKFSVLRYKKFNPQFEAAFLKNLPETKYKRYKIVKKTDNSGFYCSQYIWYLYWKTGKDLGYDLDIDKDGGYLVTPYDLLNSTYFDKVLFSL